MDLENNSFKDSMGGGRTGQGKCKVPMLCLVCDSCFFQWMMHYLMVRCGILQSSNAAGMSMRCVAIVNPLFVAPGFQMCSKPAGVSTLPGTDGDENSAQQWVAGLDTGSA